MAKLKSNNPAFNEKLFKNRYAVASEKAVMSVSGTINKTGFLTLILIASAAYAWHVKALICYGLGFLAV